MPIKRYFAQKNATISNSKLENLISTASNSNTSLCDSGMIFSMYNSDGLSTSSALNDIARILIQFDISSILSDTEVPTGTAKYYLKMFNVANSYTTPRTMSIALHPITEEWQDGFGTSLDFKDIGAVNWLSKSEGSGWTDAGGTHNTNYGVFQNLLKGHEDIEMDITNLMSTYRSGTLTNNGFMLRLSGAMEYQTTSFYTKVVSMRGTEYFFNRPTIEVRFENYTFDDRNNSYRQHPLAPTEDYTNKLYLYNRIRDRFVNIPAVGVGPIYVDFYTHSITASNFVLGATGSYYRPGIYSVSFAATSTSLIDVWRPSTNTSAYLYTGSVELKSFSDDYKTYDEEFIISMPNLKPIYNINDCPKLNVFIRKRDWESNIYLVANQLHEDTEYMKNAYFRVSRPLDGKTIIDFSTSSSVDYSRCSYDAEGNYLNLSMSLFEPNYQYELQFAFAVDGKTTVHKDKFKFKIKE